MKAHKRQSSKCSFVQSLDEIAISRAIPAIEAKEASTVTKKSVEQEVAAAASFESQQKVKSSKFFKSFKIEEFASSSSLTPASAEPCPEPAIESKMFDSEGPQMLLPHEKELKKLDAKTTTEADEASAVIKNTMEEETVTAAAVMKAVKPETYPKNIGFFDPSMTVNMPELHLFANCASFLQELSGQMAKYQESSILRVLTTCLRGPALT